MKKNIHPKYYSEAKIKCACGNVITVGSTREKMETEICSACHPFYTGKKKLVDSTGRVDRFKKKMEKTEQMKKSAATQKKTKTTKSVKIKKSPEGGSPSGRKKATVQKKTKAAKTVKKSKKITTKKTSKK